MRVVMWGTYDEGKPRTRIIKAALREAGVDLVEVHSDVWRGIEDKSRLRGVGRRLSVIVRWLASYPGLVWRYLRAPPHDALLIGYPGHLDVLVVWPFARLRGKMIVWDAFLSLYDTVVLDRKLVSGRNPLTWVLRGWEWLACRAADRVVLDTEAHARLFRELYGAKAERTAAVFVGAETQHFRPVGSGGAAAEKPPDRPATTLLFYGQFIPLHGIETIVAAAQESSDPQLRWVLIGRGQEEERIRRLLRTGPEAELEWHPWVPYEELNAWIDRADLCLGIFGATGKAARVIPNKVFQILAAGKPIVTRDGPAIRELLSEEMPGVYLVPPADPMALLAAVQRFRADRERGAIGREALHREVSQRFSLPSLGSDWSMILDAACHFPRC